ncbi:MAG: peptidylprolyl isomerase [Verrucomicrobiales bacterium]|nr:peptidylprolyl isomerase [Verrucomicrobiales bacterium]MCP5525746.1 peptidylprolyl isomerase [Verrucomicrobiales bacterium]
MLSVACGLLASLPAAAQENGIYADFQTSMGTFTCRLDPVHAPQATANFIGLATGARNWIEPGTGGVRREPFYNGAPFHRVIDGFMIQGGSPNGQGTDNPGFVFPDEFDPAQRHDAPGVLSMANSGPDSNGAQFFVTVAATPWLNDVHTILGRVSSGQEIVNAISKVDTDADDHPTTPVVLEHVTIRRVGAEAEAFDIDAQDLPEVAAVALGIQPSGNGVALRYEGAVFAEHLLRSATGLGTWTATSLGVHLSAPADWTIERANEGTAGFYSLTQVRYPATTRAPRDLTGRVLAFAFAEGLGDLTVTFDAQGGGAFDYNGTPGTLRGYSWKQAVYRGELWPIEFDGLVPMTLRLSFADEQTGTFSGTAYTQPTISVSGSFSLGQP